MTPTWPDRPVAIVAPRYAPAVGGVERYVEQLTMGLLARGVPVEVVTTDPAARSAVVEVRDGVTVRRFPTLAHDATYYPSPALARWLRREIGRYSLLHLHNLHSLVPAAAAWARRPSQTPMTLTAHYHGAGHTSMRRLLHVPYRPLARAVVHATARIVCNSEAERGLLERDFGRGLPTIIIPEGVDLPSPPGGPIASAAGPGAEPDGSRDATTILSVGRLETYKGVHNVVAALPFLPAGWRLVVVGSGPARAAIEHAAAAAGVASRVVLRGRVSDDELRAWYASAAVAISLSQHESFGLMVLESAAAGLPVVASDIGAHRESQAFVGPGRLTLVAPDAPGSMVATAIMAARAQGRSNDRIGWHLPSWDGLVDGVLDVYRDVIRVSRLASTSPLDHQG